MHSSQPSVRGATSLIMFRWVQIRRTRRTLRRARRWCPLVPLVEIPAEPAPEQQEEDRADDRADPGAEVPELVDRVAEAQRPRDAAGQQRAADADQAGDDDAAGLLSGEDRLGDESGDQPDQNAADDPHGVLLAGRMRTAPASRRPGHRSTGRYDAERLRVPARNKEA